MDQSVPLVQFVNRPGVIDLAWGHPDPDLLPVEGLRNASARVFERYGADALNYGYAAGPGPLIDWLCGRLSDVDGRAATPDQVVISAGTSQALDQVTTLFTKPGDVVLVESPTYHLAVRILRDHPLELVPIAADEDGVRVDALHERLVDLKRGKRRVAFLYTVPTYNNPTGASLAMDRRRQLAELASAERLVIIEDDAYRELSYDGSAPASLWSLAEPGAVIRLGSFAKSLAPGLRSGFITADVATIKRIRESGLLDSGGAISHFSSLVVAEFARTGEYSRNVERLRAAYRQRRDALLAALSEHLKGLASWGRPAGGYFVWLTLLESQSLTGFPGAAEAEGTAFMPGTAFYPEASSGVDSLRLSFSRYPPEALAEGARRLGNALRRHQADVR
ncbi:MAG: PLP-dependent aminotransferase family protein [Chloroflexi bacterium]|nr:MAG: PLP-dependent aminotransferase family protein [Chloroflexota bacterium]